GIARAVGNGTIIDDDRLAISIGDVTQFESSAPLTNFTFNVFLSAATTQDVTVAYTTADDTAKAGIDYTATSGTLTIKAGTTMTTISVPVIANALTQPNVDFFVNLPSPINASIAKIQGVGTIVDADAIPDVSAGDVSITIGNSGGTTVNVPVFLSFPLAQAVSVNY